MFSIITSLLSCTTYKQIVKKKRTPKIKENKKLKVKDIQGTGKRLGNSTDKHGTFSIRSRRDYQLRLKIPLRSTHNLVLMVSRGTGRGACMCICLSLTKLICTASLSILSKREEKIAKRFCVNFAPFNCAFFSSSFASMPMGLW